MLMALEISEVYRLVSEDMIGMAMKLLHEGLEGSSYELQSRYENVMMLCLQYCKYADQDMSAKVKSEVLQLSDDILDSLAARSAIKYEYSIRRSWNISNEMLVTALSSNYDTSHNISIELDAQLIVLFRQVWLSGFLDANTVQRLRDFVLADGEKNSFARRVVVGALMLRCIRYYDIRIVSLLMDSSLPEAVVAIVMVMLARMKRIDCDECSLQLFENYLSDSENLGYFALAYNNVMRTFETKLISSEMRDKIIPKIKEQGYEFLDNKDNTQFIDENGLNPDWEEKLEESGILDEMRRINDMQMSGADINYATFLMGKSSAFFQDTAHWFFPFDIRYHLLEGMATGEDDHLNDFSQVLNLCDTDRYSLFIILKNMGVCSLDDALRTMNIGNYDEAREQLMNEELWKHTASASFANRLRFAVMNLFRFYTLAPNHSDMLSPFDNVIPTYDSKIGYQIIPHNLQYEAANVLFKAQQWDYARSLYLSAVVDYIDEDPLIYQKTGYCSEKLQRWDEAVVDYNKSDVLLPDDLWTLRHSAFCYRQLGEKDIAAGIYRKVIDLTSDNNSSDSISNQNLDVASVNALNALADIYIESEDFNEAKPLLHKLEFIRGSHTDISRLGYCLFMLGDKAEAIRLLERACYGSEASPLDYFMLAISSADESDMTKAYLALMNSLNADDDSSESAMQKLSDTLAHPYLKSMLSFLPWNKRYEIKSTINKLILEQ